MSLNSNKKLTKENTFAMLVDIQQKLMPHINKNTELLQNVLKLIKGLEVLDIQIVLNEQYPKGLGTTVLEIKSLLPNIKVVEKTTFSCVNEQSLPNLKALKKKTVLVFGTETHICVLQTCLDLLANGFVPILVTNACGTRYSLDHKIALKRLEQAGVILTTYESILFELVQDAKNPLFKQISALVK